MGGSVVYFDKERGANYTKGKKRMRGDYSSSPEIKKWNGFLGNAGMTSVDFVNNVIPGSGTFGNFQPCRIQWPQVGASPGFRIGNRIKFLGFRLKGWITLAADQLKQIRWRIVLVRLDLPAGNLTFDAAAYLSQWVNPDASVPTTWNHERWESYCRHNFYKKFKDVSNTSFKTKVLASGVLPPTITYSKMYFNLSGTIANSNALLTTGSGPGSTPSYIMGVHSGNSGYLPIDVKVKLNDNVDCQTDMRRYFVVLESDCGYGWTNEGAASSNQTGMIVNMYSRCYFTDA